MLGAAATQFTPNWTHFILWEERAKLHLHLFFEIRYFHVAIPLGND